MFSDIRRLLRVGLLLPLMIVSLAVPTAALADDDDDDDRFGAWLHAGTVEDFNEEPLARFGSLEEEDDWDDLDDFNFDFSSVDITVFWETDDEDVNLTVDQLLAEPHVIVVRAENDLSSPVIAIGLIEGDVDARGELTIALQPVDGSGFTGLAHFEPEDDDDDDETDVDIVIWEGEPVTIGTPVA